MSSNIREASPPERGHEDDAQLNNQDELKRPCPQAYKVFREIDYHPELCSNCSEKRSERGAHTGEKRHYYRKTGPNGVSEDRFCDGCGAGKHQNSTCETLVDTDVALLKSSKADTNTVLNIEGEPCLDR